MFHIERWPGPEGRSGTAKADPSAALQRLNAKARERAAAARQRSAAEGSPPVSASAVEDLIALRGENGSSLVDAEVQGEVKVAKKQRKRKLPNDGASFPAAPLTDGEIAENAVEERNGNGFNNEKHSVPHEASKKDVAAAEAQNSKFEVRRKKRKVRKEAEAVLEVLEAELPEVNDQRHAESTEDLNSEDRTKKKRKKEKRVDYGKVFHDDTEEEIAADKHPESAERLNPKSEKKKKKKKKAEEGAEQEGLGDKQAPLRKGSGEVDRIAVDGRRNGSSLNEEVLEEEGDLEQDVEPHADGLFLKEADVTTIEKDVERILGLHDAPPEPQDKGPVLPWMRDPLDIGTYNAVPLPHVPGLDIRLREALNKSGIKTLFPVQMAVWHETVGPGLCERDMCVSSPTGSGKTLAYALPIVQKLSSRVLRLLRALVVLPSRDLATQVKGVLDDIAPAVGLSVGLAIGQTSITTEAAELVRSYKSMVHGFGDPTDADIRQPESRVDILVATPGRLMDHLRNTVGFTLQHLQFLVVDETDRLLRQAYQDWLPNVLAAVTAESQLSQTKQVAGSALVSQVPRAIRTIRRFCPERGERGTMFPRLVKIVLSATITRDPAKIAQLDLYRPILVASESAGSRYQLPSQLRSYKVVCKPGDKPLYLWALLQQLGGQSTIVFTASVVATHRLYTLLNSFKDRSLNIVEYSSLQHQQSRSKALEKFRTGQAHVLIASDAMTRGMDVEGVANVVNYDVPVYAKTYVHRVGRTARAGQPGTAYTLLRKEEGRHFRLMLSKVENSKCKDYSVPALLTEGLQDDYTKALERLKLVVAEEAALRTHGKQKLSREAGVSDPDNLFM